MPSNAAGAAVALNGVVLVAGDCAKAVPQASAAAYRQRRDRYER